MYGGKGGAIKKLTPLKAVPKGQMTTLDTITLFTLQNIGPNGGCFITIGGVTYKIC
jgi:hypothetical protein